MIVGSNRIGWFYPSKKRSTQHEGQLDELAGRQYRDADPQAQLAANISHKIFLLK